MGASTTALLFGDSLSPLYGVYYSPRNCAARDQGVLICPPIGHEYMRSHLAVDRLARRLAKEGFTALKFDYFATGDSAGETEEGSCERWRESIRLAIEELMDLAGTHRISIVGLRFGASLAASLELQSTSIESFVAWDLVVSGGRYIGELQRMHDEMLGSTFRGRHIERDDELIGFAFPPSMRESIAGIDLSESLSLSPARCLLVSSSESPDLDAAKSAAESRRLAAYGGLVSYW